MPPNTPTDPWPLPELQRARRAIVVVDVVESVRLMQEDESGFIDRWRRFVNEVRTEVLPAHGGRLVKSLGDGMLLEFEGVRPAVAAALSIQQLISTANAEHLDAMALRLRVGVHVADVVIDELDLFGTGVNLAARIAALAEPGDIVVSVHVRDEIVDGLDAELEDMGSCWLKHIDAAVHAFRVRAPSGRPRCEMPLPPQPAVTLGVAVLPLSCVEGSDRDALLGDFIADGLIAALSLTPELKVLSRLSTRVAAARSLDVRQAGQLLGAAYLVSGSYAVLGGRTIINIEVADARDGTVVAARRRACAVGALFEHPSEPLEALVDDTYRAILETEAKRTQSRPLPTLESYSLLLGSIGLLHRTARDDFDHARTVLDTLIDRVPRHGASYAWLAKWHYLRMIRGIATSPQRERAEARLRIDQSLERDPYSGTAWALRGLSHAFDGHDLTKAEEAYDHALMYNPSEPLAWLYMATLRSWQGRGVEAATAADHALALSPLDPMRYYFESLAAAGMLAAQRFDVAISLCCSSLRVHRSHTPTHRVLTIAQMLSGREEEARKTMQLMRELEPTLTAQQYLDRYPGRDSPHALVYADALRAAGLPD